MIAELNCILIFGPNSAQHHPLQSTEVSEITQRGIQSSITKALTSFPSSLWALIAEKTFIASVVSGNFNSLFPSFACLVSPLAVQCCFASWIIFTVVQYLQLLGHPQLHWFPSLATSWALSFTSPNIIYLPPGSVSLLSILLHTHTARNSPLPSLPVHS